MRTLTLLCIILPQMSNAAELLDRISPPVKVTFSKPILFGSAVEAKNYEGLSKAKTLIFDLTGVVRERRLIATSVEGSRRRYWRPYYYVDTSESLVLKAAQSKPDVALKAFGFPEIAEAGVSRGMIYQWWIWNGLFGANLRIWRITMNPLRDSTASFATVEEGSQAQAPRSIGNLVTNHQLMQAMEDHAVLRENPGLW